MREKQQTTAGMKMKEMDTTFFGVSISIVFFIFKLTI